MPLIEELPLSTKPSAQAGWAWVPDTSANLPVLASSQPPSRKRARLDASSSTAASQNAKQAKATAQRLKELDRENYKDVAVPIPKREKSLTTIGGQPGKKATSNVRRILGYNRNFGHYLADEEAALQAGGGGFQGTWGSGASTSANTAAQAGGGAGRKDPSHRKSIGAGRDAPKARGKAAAQTKVEADAAVKQEPSTANPTEMSGTAAPTSSTQQPLPHPKPRYDPILDHNPLLRTTGLPKKPSDRVMAALLAEPPLSYTEARAKPLPEEKQRPRRHFCAMCGYWGKVRCRRCGERCCGLLECWKGHEAAGCVP